MGNKVPVMKPRGFLRRRGEGGERKEERGRARGSERRAFVPSIQYIHAAFIPTPFIPTPYIETIHRNSIRTANNGRDTARDGRNTANDVL